MTIDLYARSEIPQILFPSIHWHSNGRVWLEWERAWLGPSVIKLLNIVYTITILDMWYFFISLAANGKNWDFFFVYWWSGVSCEIVELWTAPLNWKFIFQFKILINFANISRTVRRESRRGAFIDIENCWFPDDSWKTAKIRCNVGFFRCDWYGTCRATRIT